MDYINKPDLQIKDVFKQCISKVKNEDLKKKLEACVEELQIDETVYDKMAIANELHSLPRKNIIGKNISNEEMKKIYTNRMVPRKSPGREFYDQILSITNICPFCSTRIVSTLDHYLPKNEYSSLVVTPINLVPSCSDCNKIKSDKIPESAEELTLHPYYDDINDETWLYAKIVQDEEPLFDFYVEPPRTWDLILQSRIQYHFEVYQLRKLYGVHAVQEFNGIKKYIHKLYNQGGENEVKSYLNNIEQSLRAGNSYLWKYAMYKALAEDEWFINQYLPNNVG